MCKKVLMVMVVLAVVVTVSGCNAVDGIFEDTVGTAQAIRSKITTPMADKAKERDAEMSGEKVARYYAEQAGRFASFKKEAK